MALKIEEPSRNDSINEIYNDFLLNALSSLEMTIDDLTFFDKLSPYLILDGHRSGNKNYEIDPIQGYIEGAKFSIRFANLLKKLGCNKATFLIHTLRNYSTKDRMYSIFNAVEEIAKEFISSAFEQRIKLRYFGKDVHTSYHLADIINEAELITANCEGFNLNYITNYSEEWAMTNQKIIYDLPEINVIARFTKGHSSGANLPGISNKANFVYIQQASINAHWSDEELILLALSLLKSFISLRGFVGGKIYNKTEKELIFKEREENLWEGNYLLSNLLQKEFNKPSKRIMSFTPIGPVTIKF